MRDVALKSLLYDRGKLIASLGGVAFAATLLWVQIGLFTGFLDTSSALVRRVGGDVWVMAKGTQVVDNGEPLSAGSALLLASNPCVERVRGLVLAVLPSRKPSGAIDAVQVVGIEPGGGRLVPWTMVAGLPSDLHKPMRVAVDEHERKKLQIEGELLGASLEVAGKTAYVAGVTEGIRSFALYPYLFTDIVNARALSGLGEGEAHYFIADLKDRACRASVIRAVGAEGDLEAHSAEDFADITEDYWVFGSGAGGALGFSALFALVVGAVIVGQTLFSITKEHLRELCTLKAIGASAGELVAFVAWQASFLAFVGGGMGAVITVCLQSVLSRHGIQVVLSPTVICLGSLAVVTMCTLASVPSVRKVLVMDSAEVFR